MAALAVAVLLFLRETDELQRRIQLEALGFAFAAGSLVTFSHGLLQLAGLPLASWGTGCGLCVPSAAGPRLHWQSASTCPGRR
jgi:hypothetical protein